MSARLGFSASGAAGGRQTACARPAASSCTCGRGHVSLWPQRQPSRSATSDISRYAVQYLGGSAGGQAATAGGTLRRGPRPASVTAISASAATAASTALSGLHQRSTCASSCSRGAGRQSQTGQGRFAVLASAAATGEEAALGSGGGVPDPADLDEMLYRPGEDLPYYLGPLELREVPGSGVGLFATRAVPAGTLLLICHPLAAIREPAPGPDSRSRYGAAGAQPLDLAEALAAGEAGGEGEGEGQGLSPLAAAWLQALHGATAEGGGGAGTVGSRAGRLRQLLKQPFGPGAASAPLGSCAPCPLPPEALARVVALNAYREPGPDPAVVEMRLLPESERGPCLGLWPAFSLLNHSCAPSGAYGLVGGAMVVRAAADLAEGEEVTVSYFGRRALAPLPLRRSYLAQHYGFDCACRRCRMEEALADSAPAASGPEAAGAAGAGPDAGPGPDADPDLVRRRAVAELPAYLEALHGTCSRMAAPHLRDLLTGRRWTGGGQAAAAAEAGGAGADAGGEGEGGGGAAAAQDEPVSEVTDELSQLYGYLSGCWQQVLSVAAAAAGPSSEDEDEDEEGSEASTSGRTSEAAEGGAPRTEGLSEEEVLWLEGSVFVLLDLMASVLCALGCLEAVQAQHAAEVAEAAAARVGAGRGGRGGRRGTTAQGRGRGRRGGAGRGRGAARRPPVGKAGADGDGGEVEVEVPAGAKPSATAAEEGAERGELTAAEAIRRLGSQRWALDELPRPLLVPYVDLLAQGLDMANAVAPGSDMAAAFAVRLLAGCRAVLEAEEEEEAAAALQQVEIDVYDALCARYGIVEYDTYERILEVLSAHHRAGEVRLPFLAPGPRGEGGGAAAAASQQGAAGMAEVEAEEGGVVGVAELAAEVEEGGMVGARALAVPVEAEVVG
ncbi:hypothetical protein HYH03_016865 [Edaphochlamys debaryana]|uniref:SET domain-containing protein n=1 Tax=Edaphochlamys debaryana TaxID=47281 RepID=A0A835XHR5_9CHLO|nr:hypothetical protein HYH03_016865 [Edaphochlamys debaryana]|eukprot:KAG2484323.1 hypothetical protein HYH03_016865 [Edaphochlamys debaryana]